MRIIILLSFLACVSCGKDEGNASPKSEVQQETIKPLYYLSLVNRHRQDLGLQALKFSPIITEVAATHAHDMASGEVRFGHAGFKARCARLQVELGAISCGEIVARGQKDEEAVLKSWLNSSSHRKTIEKPEYNYTGYAQELGRDGRRYWVQIFLTIP